VKYVQVWGRKGAPVEYVKGLPVYLGDGNYIAMTAKAPNPNAAKLFIDYFLGAESSAIMASVGEFVNRQGIYPPIPGADHVVNNFVQMNTMSADEYNKKKKEYRQIFDR
jgi:iron(III) transport system substrate-binding protein